MSMEAQFYEALRRQHIIQRRQSLGVSRQVQQPKYQPHYIPVGVLRQDDMQFPWSYNPLRRTRLTGSEYNLSQNDRELHPRRSSSIQRSATNGKLHNRFSSVNYIQQW